MVEYEQTVRPEIEPCDKCGILTDESVAVYLAELRVCTDCCDEILAPLIEEEEQERAALVMGRV